MSSQPLLRRALGAEVAGVLLDELCWSRAPNVSLGLAEGVGPAHGRAAPTVAASSGARVLEVLLPMPSLIHATGPPGIGKSTLAALYADRHPGVLNLDIDRLHVLVGGWQDPAQDTHTIVRPIALAVTRTHLVGGRDVIVPQTFAQLANIEALEQVAEQAHAAFFEVILVDEQDASIERFHGRQDDSPWSQHNRERVAQRGGAEWLSDLYQQLEVVAAHRPSALVVRSESGAIEETYASIAQALAELQTIADQH